MSEANKELVRRHFEEIFNRQNFDACDDLMAEDYVEHAVAPFGQSEPGNVHGPTASGRRRSGSSRSSPTST